MFHIPQSLKSDYDVLVDALRNLLPPYDGPPIRLLRGELESRYRDGILGIAWTPHIKVARMFANRRAHLGEGRGVVLEIDATTEMIVCAPGGHRIPLKEDEHIVDPRLIQEIRIVE